LVIDTALVYPLEESNNCPSLRDISEQVLGVKMNDTHDSVEDARQALKAALHLMTNGIPAPIIRKVVLPAALLIHRIPEGYTEETVHQLLVAQTSIVPRSVETILRGGSSSEGGESSGKSSTGRCNVEFLTPAHAELAFETIAGPLRPDKSNKPQKRMYLKGGGYICVRKL
jgi:hypothetical protein